MDDYQLRRQQSQEKRARNREYAARKLKELGVEFTVKNNGAHLVVSGRGVVVDFWPGTGKFIGRNGRGQGRGQGRGINTMIARYNLNK